MTIKKIAPVLVLGMLLLLPPVSCAQKPEPGKSDASTPEIVSGSNDQVTAEEREGAAALVNGKVIPMVELERALVNVAMQGGMNADSAEALKPEFGARIMDQLITGELLYQQAVSEGYSAADEKVDEAYNEIAGRYPEPEAFTQEMESRGFSEESLKMNLERQITINDYIENGMGSATEITDDELKAAYDALPTEVKASHILFEVSEEDTQEKKDEVLARAKQIMEEARKEGADFAALAREHSEGPSARSGGDLGFFGPGRMVKAFEDAAFAMDVGQVSEPVLTQFGYHLIKVTEKRGPGTTPMEEMKESLQADVKNRKIGAAVEEKIAQLKEAADIEMIFVAPPPSKAPPGMSPGAASPH
jgi:peptidyl-prolyl cis-trans isomerase C